MFKKLKEKIAEEVKPLKIPQFAQSVVSPGSNAVVDPPPNEAFSLDDELPEDLFGNEGFSVVDLHHPSQPLPLSSGRFSRQSSMSSLASDASAFLPIHDASLGAFNMQDMESASEREDVLPQMNSVSKQELCNSYLKLYRHYQKYKGRTADLKSFCMELEKDNKKLKTVLLECQEKSLRRMAELKEQCALEQHAKAHLEEALRNDLEEKDHLIQTLQTKIKLLKEAHSTGSSLVHTEDENLHQLPGIGENVAENLTAKCDVQVHQEQQTELNQDINSRLKTLYDDSEIRTLKERIDFFKQQIVTDSNVDIKDASLNAQLHDFLNYISISLVKKVTLLPQEISNEEIKTLGNEVPKSFQAQEDEKLQGIPNVSSLNPQTNLLDIQSSSQDIIQLSEPVTDETLADSENRNETEVSWKTCSCQNTETKNYLDELENELEIRKVNFEEVAQELEISHQRISKQDSVITELQKKLSSSQGEAEEALGQKKEIIGTVDALKCELVQTKLELEEVQQQFLSLQCTVEEKDQFAGETKDNLVQINQELDKACAEKYEMKQLITNMETELSETKDVCKQLTQENQSAKETIQEKESEIKHINKDISETLKNLDLSNSEKNELNEKVVSLEKELENTKLKFQQVNKDFESLSKSTEEKNLTIINIKDELKTLHQDLKTASSQKVEACEMATSLQTDLKDIKLQFEEVTSNLQSAEELIQEKNLQIIQINEELVLCREQLETGSKANIETDEMVKTLQNELTRQSEQLTVDLRSAHELIDIRDSDIRKVREELESVLIELYTQKSEKHEMMLNLQKELLDARSQIEELTQNLQSTHKLVEEKNCDLENIQGNFANIQKELDALSSLDVEKGKLVTDLQNDLMEARNQFEKINKELQLSHTLINKKDVTIASINKDFSAVLKEVEETRSQKTETNQILVNLQNELKNTNVRVEQMVEELHSAKELLHQKDMSYAKLGEELSVIHMEADKIALERAKALGEVATLQNELLDVNGRIKDLSAELKCAHKLIDEKDSNISCLIEEVANVHKIANSTTIERQENKERMASVQNELAKTKLELEQVTQELQSANKVTEEEKLTVAHLTEELTKVHKELNAADTQQTKICTTLTDLQSELAETKLKYEQTSKEIETAHQSIEEKNSNIAHLTEDLTTVREELHSMSVLKSESCEILTTLQKECQSSRTLCDEVTQDLESTHKLLEEKNVCIEKLKEELSRVKEELDLTATQKFQASENIVNLQCELKEAMIRVEDVTAELQSAHQSLEDKKLMNEDVSNNDLHTNSSSIRCDETLVTSLQRELVNCKVKLDKFIQELHCANKIIEEKDEIIKEMREELTDRHTKLNMSLPNSDIEIVNSALESKILESTLHLESPKDFTVNSVNVSQEALPSVIFKSTKQLCENYEDELYNESIKNECSGDNSQKTEYDRTVQSDMSEKSVSHNGTQTEGECSFVTSGPSPVSDHKVVNTSEISPGCDEHISIVKTSSSELWEEANSTLQSSKRFHGGGLDFLSHPVREMHVEGEGSTSKVPETQLTVEHNDKNQISSLQFTEIQSMLEEIRRENKDYGSLLECHKNIINHLERITKVHSEGMQPGGAEWLHKQLVLLSQKLYDTKEKQRIQMASISKFVKHQEDLMKTGVNESDMAIEMQYLRNIVFQYMIGKETMLLAKVISAVMKFDQQQMDQVMQKELQKQTLFGQLGLL